MVFRPLWSRNLLQYIYDRIYIIISHGRLCSRLLMRYKGAGIFNFTELVHMYCDV